MSMQMGPQITQNETPNSAHLCRLGQEMVQEIVLKCTELFNLLKTIPLPIGTAQSLSAHEEKKNKIKICVETIESIFERLRVIYNRCSEACSGLEYIQIERLIPYKEAPDSSNKSLLDDKKYTERYKMLTEEHRKRMEILQARNKHLKDIIDSARNLVWEINTMLAMRKP